MVNDSINMLQKYHLPLKEETNTEKIFSKYSAKLNKCMSNSLNCF